MQILLFLLGPVCGSPTKVERKPHFCHSLSPWSNLDTSLIFHRHPEIKERGLNKMKTKPYVDLFHLLAWLKSDGGVFIGSWSGKVRPKNPNPYRFIIIISIVLGTDPWGNRSDLSNG